MSAHNFIRRAEQMRVVARAMETPAARQNLMRKADELMRLAEEVQRASVA